MEDYSNSKELILELVDIASRGGNLLLNVGPTADGRIPVIMQERLLDIGAWLEVNGEAIYETMPHDFKKIKSGESMVYFTAKKKEIYIFFSRWPEELVLELAEDDVVKNISLLGYDGKITWKKSKDNQLIITIPPLTIAQIPCEHVWVFKIDKI